MDTVFAETNQIPFALQIIFLITFSFFRDFDTLRECINKELEKCKDSTPANIVDAFFKFLKKQMPCQAPSKTVSAPLNSSKPNDASASLFMVTNTIFITFTILVFRFQSITLPRYSNFYIHGILSFLFFSKFQLIIGVFYFG